MLQTQPVGNRIILLTAGIGLALCAAWGGSEWVASPKGWWGMGGLWTIAVASIIIAAISYFVVLSALSQYGSLDSLDSTVSVVLAAVSLGFLFGCAAVPFAAEGKWYSPWLSLFILAFTPMVIAIKDTAKDANDALNTGTASSGHVQEAL